MNKKADSDSSSLEPAVDLSFRCINTAEDILLEKPRYNLRSCKVSSQGKYYSRAIRLNNNTLTDLKGFKEVIEKLLDNSTELAWIDLSFNDLSAIDPVLTQYPELQVLNLHGNSIAKLSEVDKLGALPNLKRLTLHGNPIETEKGYRNYVLSVLPHLKSLDFSSVTKQERATAEMWKRTHSKPKRMKQEVGP
ncbi:leucine-rich repeat-containing protein 51 [Protopterus annectens]|uniref:leucine-rich repeat-containing protein 51 n=1 Tax=Protopterus annectens TaxID=7888 RepID=UPI001CFA48F8|nr:leucine-rich repeat-containing protein 51 [Protopterus annectens]